jgi:hypothetical protein
VSLYEGTVAESVREALDNIPLRVDWVLLYWECRAGAKFLCDAIFYYSLVLTRRVTVLVIVADVEIKLSTAASVTDLRATRNEEEEEEEESLSRG